MKQTMCYVLCVMFYVLSIDTQGQVFIEETEVDTSTIITGLDIPWEILWGPDNHIWATERFGRVSRIHPATGEQDVILDISSIVHQTGEAGLLGMVLHPDFGSFPYVYLAYTYMDESEIKEKMVRYTYQGGLLINETPIIDNIRGNATHDGCRMIITPDLKLIATTGDAQNQPAAQDVGDLSGKILRLNLDGSIPSDNPFPGNPVYSYGHRNAQGLLLAENGILYSSEHGPATDDEFNIIEPGRNYGWPNVHGFCDLPDEITFCETYNVKEPQTAWTPTIATSDIVYYNHPAIPEWQGSILMVTLKNKRIYELELNEDGTIVVDQKQFFYNWWGRLRDICIGPAGEIYIAHNGPTYNNSTPFTHSIIRVANPIYLGTEESPNKSLPAIEIYPNPANKQISVVIKENVGSSQWILLSANGSIVAEGSTHQQEFIIKRQSLPSGIYILRVWGDKLQPVSERILFTDF